MLYLTPLLLYRCVYMEVVSHRAYYIMFLYFLGIVYYPLTSLILYLEI